MAHINAPTLDYLLGERVRLHQSATGYRAGLDAVLLGAAVQAQAGDQILELGTGAGAAALCLLARCDGITVHGIEKDEAMLNLAQKNIGANKREATFTLHHGDIATARLGLFDQVFSNPPFHDSARHGDGNAASHMPDDVLRDWISCASRHLKPRGILTLIHRADALPVLLQDLQDHDFGAIRIRPVLPRAQTSAKRIVLNAVKSRKTPLELLPPLIVHEGETGYTEEARAILRDGAALAL